MTEQQESSDSPRWLKYIEEMIEEEEDEVDSEAIYYEIVRDLLLSEQDLDKAVSEAIQRFYDHYVAGFSEEDLGGREPPEYDAGGYLNSIAVIVFELVAKIPFTDPKQDMLSKFLIGIAKNAADSFDEKNPRFVCWSWGIQAAAVERWNACHIDAGRLDREGPAVDGAIDIWLSTTALIAKLFQADLLGAYGPLWLTYDFIRAFKTHTDGDYTKHPVRQAQILAVAIYILLAGEAFAQDAKISSPERRYDLDAENWRLWASKLKEISDTVNEDVRWDLKGKTQKAYEKMVELYPEAFSSN
ncbi:hypothetical protein FOC1_g10016546 [Fusarium oxysporum f. sp. cubense race 1]|uniref:Uncharacterized protein n=1 Tax=Fusarium oxysporum f. sp. cubense (strain race 1) TaxID=1229664 RepID=N4TGQ6_FUSC1|nr:hypothetical protein FOC1_g10016546 [Fusarium oxysporum f. sp. cubense race 1]